MQYVVRHSKTTNDQLLIVAGYMRQATVMLNDAVREDVNLNMLETESVRSFLRRAVYRLEHMAGVRKDDA